MKENTVHVKSLFQLERDFTSEIAKNQFTEHYFFPRL